MPFFLTLTRLIRSAFVAKRRSGCSVAVASSGAGAKYLVMLFVMLFVMFTIICGADASERERLGIVLLENLKFTRRKIL